VLDDSPCPRAYKHAGQGDHRRLKLVGLVIGIPLGKPDVVPWRARTVVQHPCAGVGRPQLARSVRQPGLFPYEFSLRPRVDERAVDLALRTIWLTLTRWRRAPPHSRACITCSLSGRTGSVVLPYDPPDSSSLSPGTILKRFSPIGAAGDHDRRMVHAATAEGADAFPAFLVSHPSGRWRRLPFLLGSGSALPVPDNVVCECGGSVGCRSEGGLPKQALKLAGANRSKGSGVLCPGGARTSSHTLAPAGESPAA